jgi:hypothetical protein
MDTLKPSSGVLLNPAHPLAHNLIGCWLMSEGAGSRVYDCSPSRNTGTLQGNTCFRPGRFGTGLLFDGSGDYVTIGGAKGTRATIAFWCRSVNDASTKGLYGYSEYGGGSRLDLDIRDATVYWIGVYNWLVKWELSASIDPTQWCHICVQCGIGGAKLYVNGRLTASDPDEYCFNSWVASDHRIGWDYHAASDQYFNGTIDHVVMYNRTLSAGEIAQLYHEPFVMFKTSERRRLVSAAGTTYRLLSGSISATVGLSAEASVYRCIAGTTTAAASLTSTARTFRRMYGTCEAHAGLSGQLNLAGIVGLAGEARATTESMVSLSVNREQPSGADAGAQTPWLRDVLFNGVTSRAFQFRTALTRGWFWTRQSGCSAVYQGRSLAEADFANPVSIVDTNAPVVTTPPHVRHKRGLSYCYVVRRFNSRGHVEHTTSAAARLCLDREGRQCPLLPNTVFALSARLLAGNRASLSWLYCSVNQGVAPTIFYIYWNHGAAQVDLSRPLAAVAGKGPTLHQYCSDPLEAGEYTFAVQSRSNSGASSSAISAISVQIPQATCQPIQIIGAV